MTQTKYVLAFDTANEVIAVGLGVLDVEARAVQAVAAVEVAAHRASNTQLLPTIDELVAEQGIARDEIACVVVGRGPGSFTGVRIAMATAKGVAAALEVPLVGVSSLDAVAWNAWAAGVRGRLLVAADAMRKEVYPVRYEVRDGGIARLDLDNVTKAEVAASEFAEGDYLVAGDALRKYSTLFEPCGTLLDEPLWTPTGAGLLLALQAAWQAGEVNPCDAVRHNPAFVLPVYTRLSDAEENERARLAREYTATDADAMVQAGVASAAGSSAAGAPAVENPLRASKHITMNDMAISNTRANAGGIAYKPLDRAHAGAVAALEAEVMGSDAWNEALVADELGRTDRTWWAAYAADPTMPLPEDASLVGYFGGWIVDGDLQVLKVGVDPAWRRAGIARDLFMQVISDARNLGATTCSLEVRVTNAGAQAFYEALGMYSVGKRPRYYSDGEDALIMQGTLAGIAAAAAEVGSVGGMEIRSVHPDGMNGSLDAAASCSTHSCHADENLCTKVHGAFTSPSGASTTETLADLTDNAGCCASTPSKQVGRTKENKPLILAIESSCDETAAAVVNGEGVLLSDVVASQIDFHARFGGVVPEIASRKHIEAICGVCDECLEIAARNAGVQQIHWRDLDAVAVTYAPGLVGALVVGVAFAKGAAWAADIPFIGVNHMEGHLYANKIGMPDFAPPAVVSLVSGGNTMLVHMKDWGNYEILGATIDDAVGEAFDKVAKALGLGYPGGPVISRFAAQGDPAAISFPRAMMHSGDLRFSLSGLKTAVVTYINQERAEGRELNIPNICASFQQAVVDVQVKKAQMALEQTGAPTFCLGGGVAANPVLRAAYEKLCKKKRVKLVMPPLSSCGDNAGMIALVALDRYNQQKFFELNADALAHANLEDSY